jgi:hypothetical protein
VIFPLVSGVVPGFGAAPRPPEAPACGRMCLTFRCGVKLRGQRSAPVFGAVSA